MPDLLPLETVHVDALGPAWTEAVRRSSSEVQETLLAAADRLRATDRDDDSWRALSVYRALAPLATGSTTLALERAAWMCLEDPAGDDVTRRFAETASRSADEGVRLVAEAVLAECDLRGDRDAEAEARLRAALPRARGRGDLAEAKVCLILSAVFGAQRREMEALLLARRALVTVEADPSIHVIYRANALQALAEAYRSLDDVRRLAETVARMRRIADALTEPDAGRLRVTAHALACHIALRGGEPAAARRHLEAAKAGEASDPRTAGHAPTGIDYLACRIALAEGDLDDAEARVAEGPDPRVGGPGVDVAWVTLAVEVALRRGRREEAETHAHAAFVVLDREGRNGRLGTGSRLRLAERLAQVLSLPGADPALSGHAWRLAADAAFDRLFELDQCLRDLPEISVALPDDRAALAEYRERFARGHGALVANLRTILAASGARGDLPAWARAGAGGMTSVCAWCRSVRDEDGTWLPLGHFVHGSRGFAVTHGVCERCFAELEREPGSAESGRLRASP